MYILTNPVLINDTTDFYTCLQFDKAGFQKHLLATFHSFVNARYSDIPIDCNDFDA
jgi:hypothetical protein